MACFPEKKNKKKNNQKKNPPSDFLLTWEQLADHSSNDITVTLKKKNKRLLRKLWETTGKPHLPAVLQSVKNCGRRNFWWST